MVRSPKLNGVIQHKEYPINLVLWLPDQSLLLHFVFTTLFVNIYIFFVFFAFLYIFLTEERELMQIENKIDLYLFHLYSSFHRLF